jgi:hypothetical protein
LFQGLFPPPREDIDGDRVLTGDSSYKTRSVSETAIPAAALVTETAGVRIPLAMVSPVANRHWKAGLIKFHRDR